MGENISWFRKFILSKNLKPIDRISDLVQTIASLLGLIAIILIVVQTYAAVKQMNISAKQTGTAIEQTSEMRNALQSSAYQTIQAHLLEVNKIFIDNNEMWKYFYEGVDVKENEPNFKKALAIADLKLDFLIL